MKIIGPASISDLPAGLVAALSAPREEVQYCWGCDGLRRVDHGCYCPICKSHHKEGNDHRCPELT